MSATEPRRWSVAVVIPARDEAELITSCIASVRRSLAAAGTEQFTIVVVADRCADDTVVVAQRAVGSAGTVHQSADGRVGSARRRGTALALAELRARGPLDLTSTWIMATDADTTVPAAWVAGHLSQADTGAAAVAGIVEVDEFGDHGPGTARRFGRRYRVWGPDGVHPHRHGANLGIRADAYAAVGGWQPLATGEDGALWGRLVADGWTTVATAASWVRTSGRSVGRAPAGFAADLRVLSARDSGVAPASSGPIAPVLAAAQP